MRIELWAVPLSFTCLVVILAYAANEVAKLVTDSREKRKTLYRLSMASIQLVNVNGTLVLGEPLPDDPWPSSADGDYSSTMPLSLIHI